MIAQGQICQIFQLKTRQLLPLVNLVLKGIAMEIKLLGRLGDDCPVVPEGDNDVLQLVLTSNQLMQTFFDRMEFRICLLDSP